MSLALEQLYANTSEDFAVFVDQRDHLLQTADSLPPKVDLSGFDSPVTTQNVGSCTADAVTNLYENLLNQKGPEYQVDLSRMFLYHCSRKYLGLLGIDGGSSVRMSIRALANIGVCPEEDMPYTIQNLSQPPTDAQVAAAEQYRIKEYYSCRSAQEIMNALAQNMPVAISLVYMDQAHAMLVVGYDRAEQIFKVKNSWGTTFGVDGYCEIGFGAAEFMFEAFTFSLNEARIPHRKKNNPITLVLDWLLSGWSWLMDRLF